MRYLVLAFVAVAFTGGREDAAKKELERLQGEYMMIALEVDGKLVPQVRLKSATLVIKGDKYINKVKDQAFATTLRFDPTKDPKEVDMIFTEGANKDKVGKGIYKIDGDTFVLCRALDPDRARPTEFATWPDSGVFVVTWKRQGK